MKKYIPIKIKARLKNFSQYLYLLAYHFTKPIYKDLVKSKKIISSNQRHCFFGYYDLTPFSEDDKLLLGMQTQTPLRTPAKGDKLKVGYYDLTSENLRFNTFGETETWCWQQGCRLRWFPGSNEYVIYNTLVDGNYGAVVKDINTRDAIEKYPFSLYDMAINGENGLTLNFSRLQRLRPGYGYGVIGDITQDVNCPDDDGVWVVDLKTKKKELLYSLKDLSIIEPLSSMEDAEHYINHLSINPSGTVYLFLHLWVNRKQNKRYSRLFTDNIGGNNLKLINNTGYVSHYTWQSDDILIVFTWYGNNKKRYCKFENNGTFHGVIGKDLLKEDGHPSFIGNNKYMVADTYPNLARDQLLILYNLDSNKLKVLTRFKVPHNFTGEVRCDLHPRVNKSGNMICVDNVIDNYRAMSIINLEGVI